jgi:hypothetical protein
VAIILQKDIPVTDSITVLSKNHEVYVPVNDDSDNNGSINSEIPLTPEPVLDYSSE